MKEAAIVKLLLKNIDPRLASQLRGRVGTVDDLVRLGQQLEKDKQGQALYNQRAKQLTKPGPKEGTQLSQAPPPVSQSKPANPPTQIFCWRCKGTHAPRLCPQWRPPNTRTNTNPGSSEQPWEKKTAANMSVITVTLT